MGYLSHEFRRAIERESGFYYPEATELLETYSQTLRDIATIDNRSVEVEILSILEGNLIRFNQEVPFVVRRRRNVSKLINGLYKYLEKNLYS